jgi:hypothetical protein
MTRGKNTVTAELPQCPACGARHATANRFDGCCCWSCADRMAESRNRADRHNPGKGKGTPQPPSPPPRTDAASGRTRDRNRKPARRGRSERFAALNAFVDFGIADADLTPAEALVWLVLYRDTKANGVARTAQADIARRVGLDVRTVRRAVASLEAKGMLQIVRRGRLNAGPSTYRVHATGFA